MIVIKLTPGCCRCVQGSAGRTRKRSERPVSETRYTCVQLDAAGQAARNLFPLPPSFFNK